MVSLLASKVYLNSISVLWLKWDYNIFHIGCISVAKKRHLSCIKRHNLSTGVISVDGCFDLSNEMHYDGEKLVENRGKNRQILIPNELDLSF